MTLCGVLSVTTLYVVIALIGHRFSETAGALFEFEAKREDLD